MMYLVISSNQDQFHYGPFESLEESRKFLTTIYQGDKWTIRRLLSPVADYPEYSSKEYMKEHWPGGNQFYPGD